MKNPRKYVSLYSRLVIHEGILKTEYKETTITYSDPPWYMFWKPINKTIECSEPWYEEIPVIEK